MLLHLLSRARGWRAITLSGLLEERALSLLAHILECGRSVGLPLTYESHGPPLLSPSLPTLPPSLVATSVIFLLGIRSSAGQHEGPGASLSPTSHTTQLCSLLTQLAGMLACRLTFDMLCCCRRRINMVITTCLRTSGRHAHPRTHAPTHPCTHTRTHAHTHTRTHAHTHTRTHIHTYTHLACPPPPCHLLLHVCHLCRNRTRTFASWPFRTSRGFSAR
jgi:hypothetical protein